MKRSFTAIEILLGVAVASIVLGIVAMAFIQRAERRQARYGSPVAAQVTVTNTFTLATTMTVNRASIEGHTYLIFAQGVVHDQNCPCLVSVKASTNDPPRTNMPPAQERKGGTVLNKH
jgi:hypothetical protein